MVEVLVGVVMVEGIETVVAVPELLPIDTDFVE